MTALSCRFCGTPLRHSFLDLGKVPLSNAFLEPEACDASETYYPLHARVCDACWLVQVPELQRPEAIFKHYPYFSSFSDSWLRHAEAFSARAARDLGLSERSLVVEIACNDGYLLQYFRARSIPVFGVEPAENVARVAEAKGIPVAVEFFGLASAQRLRAAGRAADLLVANNVLAHVPDLNDFVAGLRVLLKPGGLLSVEFPHLLRLIEQNQFDTIYHEHFSYFSLLTAEQVFRTHGLRVVDVEELSTHGGSLRLSIRHEGEATPVSQRLEELRRQEAREGLGEIETYGRFAARVRRTKRNILALLIRLKEEGKTVAAYGAPAKGTILLHYCGIGEDFLEYAVDRNPAKQGRCFPGTRLPIFPPERLFATRPDYVLILPWNLEAEIREQLAGIRDWGGRLIVPIPEPRVLE